MAPIATTETARNRRTTDTGLTAALAQLEPWQRNTMFILGAVVFSLPVLDHVLEVIRGTAGDVTLLHLSGDGVFLFAGILAMVPQLAIRVMDHLAVWRGLRK